MLEVLELIRPLLESYGINFKWFVDAVLVVGSARLVMKPLMLAVAELVKSTPTLKDDQWYDALLQSKGYKTVALIVDYVLSLKLPRKE